ncbi:hypothetical protein [Methyloceanibacter methanicus]|nr:hypothetical protein [Methyloceanibacter methanicus]
MSPLIRDLGGGPPIDITGKVDVTGKVDSELKGQADVNVRVHIDGPGRVKGMSATSEGHIRANVGTSTMDIGVKP